MTDTNTDDELSSLDQLAHPEMSSEQASEALSRMVEVLKKLRDGDHDLTGKHPEIALLRQQATQFNFFEFPRSQLSAAVNSLIRAMHLASHEMGPLKPHESLMIHLLLNMAGTRPSEMVEGGS